MPSNLTFRAVKEEDKDFLLSLFASAREKEIATLDWDDEQRRAFIEMQFEAQQSHYRQHYPERDHGIFLADGHAIGMTDIARRAEEIRVLDIILRPEVRNGGIGTALMHSLLDESDASGKPLRLYVEKFNPALRLYLRLGFRIIEDTGVHYHMERFSGQARTLKDTEESRAP